MLVEIDIQNAGDFLCEVSHTQIRYWATTTLLNEGIEAEMTVRLVDESESTYLNETYRHGCGPTNVLSFEFNEKQNTALRLIGDVVICVPVVQGEAVAQGKTLDAHWAHMVVHGTLHLLGYKHESEAEAERMELLETAIMRKLGFSDPYYANI